MNDTDLAALMRRFTPKQRATLTRLDRAPWSWFISDARFFALVAEYDRDSRIRYWQVLSRVTAYDGPDYRVQLPGQTTWIRARKEQFEQAADLGMPHRIGVLADEPYALTAAA